MVYNPHQKRQCKYYSTNSNFGEKILYNKNKPVFWNRFYWVSFLSQMMQGVLRFGFGKDVCRWEVESGPKEIPIFPTKFDPLICQKPTFLPTFLNITFLKSSQLFPKGPKEITTKKQTTTKKDGILQSDGPSSHFLTAKETNKHNNKTRFSAVILHYLVGAPHPPRFKKPGSAPSNTCSLHHLSINKSIFSR